MLEKRALRLGALPPAILLRPQALHEKRIHQKRIVSDLFSAHLSYPIITHSIIPPQLRLPGQPGVRIPREQERHARLRLLLQEHRRHGGERRLQVPESHIRSLPTQGVKCTCSIRLETNWWFCTPWWKSTQPCYMLKVNNSVVL